MKGEINIGGMNNSPFFFIACYSPYSLLTRYDLLPAFTATAYSLRLTACIYCHLQFGTYDMHLLFF